MNQDYKPTPLRQTSNRNCGQTCVAMITGLPLDFIIKEFGHNHGTRDKDISKNLYVLGWDNGFKVETGQLPDLCVLSLSVNCFGKRWLHYAVYHKGKIYDTNALVYDLSEQNLKIAGYKVKGFIIVTHP